MKSILKDINGNPLSIAQVEWWLLKYSDYYKKTSDFVYSQHHFIIANGSTVRLPTHCEPTDQEKFLNLYEALEAICDYHRNEKYFKEEMMVYQKIKNSQADLKNWLVKNEDLGAESYVCFLIDYLDYSEIAEHLNIHVPLSEEMEIYIDRQDFKHTIEFLEIFNELYWIGKQT